MAVEDYTVEDYTESDFLIQEEVWRMIKMAGPRGCIVEDARGASALSSLDQCERYSVVSQQAD